MRKRINYNDLLPWFTDDHRDLPPRYVARTQKFFDELGTKRQASSNKLDNIGFYGKSKSRPSG